ncbi:MAG: nucleotide sugar dehydrogenase [Paracoccaceae bacterium]
MISETIAVIGLGYVGLPVAVAFARQAKHVTGFDHSPDRIKALDRGEDSTGEVSGADISASGVRFTSDPAGMAGTSFFVVTVPTPVDGQKRPDLRPLRSACASIGPHLSRGSVVVFESTVFPGATEEICGPALEAASGLACGSDFTLGYSPERINPGDRTHRLEDIVKVVSGQDEATLRRIAAAYSAIIPAGVFEAASIRVAEAAKVIENTQRDLNIALMNELALIFERLGLRTRDVLDAAGTKWNFLPFTPGLVGGHCIGVDPYYLTAKAEAVGYRPQVILAGRQINDEMGAFVARKTIKLMAAAGISQGSARVGLLGLTFKENVPDLRNSRVPEIVRELSGFGIEPLIHDPLAGPEDVRREFGREINGLETFRDLDAVIVAVSHAAYLGDRERLLAMLRPGGVFVDLKSAFAPSELRPDVGYWSL